MAFESGLLWKLSFKNTLNSYLFGTIHLNSSILNDNRILFSSLLNQCNAFAAEIDMDKMEFSNMQSYFRLPDGQNWKEAFKNNQWDKMQSISKKLFHLDLDQFSTIYPLLLINQLSLQLIGRQQEKSLDQILWEMATEAGLEKIGLEDFHQHFSMIEEIKLSDQLKMLKDLFSNLHSSRKLYLKMISDYQKQDNRSIYHISRKMLGKYRTIMLIHRNHIISNRIVEIGASKTCFFTCGAGHLYGNQGVLRNLKKQGIKLQPVNI
ncbi:MAG: TraB/GumN family protein [Saprospiraceae bacterium]|nr:TraB/GumN family protein [Saprospiraceae bacterium]